MHSQLVELFGKTLKFLLLNICVILVLTKLVCHSTVSSPGVLKAQLLLVVQVELQLVQAVILLLIFYLELVVLSLTLIGLLNETLVGLLASEELANNFLNIVVTSTSPDLHESVFSFLMRLHLTLHAALEELRPDLLHEALGTHLDFVLILALVLGLFSDLVLSHFAFISLLNGLFLILNADVQSRDSFLTLLLVAGQLAHQTV